MAKIGIMGGTFNPIHNAHLLIANVVLHKLKLDKVIFIPNNKPASIEHKHVIAPAVDRMMMTSLGVISNPRFESSSIEIRRHGVSHTYDTIKELKKRYPNDTFYIIVGSDEASLLSEWYKINKLSKLAHFVSVNRGDPLNMKNTYHVIHVKSPRFDISSTLIRYLLYTHQSVRYLVPDRVIEFIHNYHLYQ